MVIFSVLAGIDFNYILSFEKVVFFIGVWVKYRVATQVASREPNSHSWQPSFLTGSHPPPPPFLFSGGL